MKDDDNLDWFTGLTGKIDEHTDFAVDKNKDGSYTVSMTYVAKGISLAAFDGKNFYPMNINPDKNREIIEVKFKIKSVDKNAKQAENVTRKEVQYNIEGQEAKTRFFDFEVLYCKRDIKYGDYNNVSDFDHKC